MILQSVQAILIEVQCGCIIVQKTHSILNCSKKLLQKQYQKYQHIRVKVDETSNRPTNQTIKQLNQQLTKNIRLIRPKVIKQLMARNKWTINQD